MQKASLDQLKIEREPEGESEPRRWIGIAVAIAAVAVAAAWWLFRPAAAIEVRTAVARGMSTAEAGTVLNASGYVTARRAATVSSEITGKVVEVLIEEGMRVEQGQILARLDDANLRANYELAEAQVHSARTALDETQALLDEARANHERTQNLVRRELASEAELDRARALAESLAAILERKRADIAVAQKGLEVWQRQLEDTVIRAPFAGIVVAKNAQPGEMISPVSAGGGFTRTGIGTIVDMASLEIEIDVNEAYINRVSPGQQVVATLDAYPDWKIPCHVIAIIPTADRQRATVEVRVGFDELDERVLPDMGVKVAFRDAEIELPAAGTVSVPASALHTRDGRDVVFVVNEGVLERRAVAVTENSDGEALLASGLVAGERVVVDGPADITGDMKVREQGE
ncbi:MAG: efflux RND transporter periplasmic adaptor subunit [Xanthomonadales bacterium]|nr:efflux RND transporter periplasmic adaptor subunit [Xanthomonadales bacterium]NIX13370.1 efflux RND transporter periplasmic adaptor subunit [Xanthomonadales bacterium]